MSEKYKLVPVEPTREMWAAAGNAVVALSSHHHDAISEAVYKAMLAAAPEVEQEPVGYANGDELDNMLDDRTAVIGPVRNSFHTKPLYLHPQPAEHHPECGCCGQTYRCDDDCDAVVIGGHRAAEQQPAPDVAALVEALEQYADDHNWCYDTCNIGRDVAKKALAAHRKGGEK